MESDWTKCSVYQISSNSTRACCSYFLSSSSSVASNISLQQLLPALSQLKRSLLVMESKNQLKAL